jgi:imidazolonepropionase-like amidohydrolase
MIVFEHADVLDAAAGALLKNRFVRVEGSTIADVSDKPVDTTGARVIDARGKVLMPGLIDCHVHVLASMLNAGRLAKMPNVLTVLRAVPILQGMLMRGFTTVRDAAGADWSLAEAVRTGLVEGPRIFPSGRALSQTGGHGDFRERNDVIEPCPCTPKIGAMGRVVDGVDAVRRAVREEPRRRGRRQPQRDHDRQPERAQPVPPRRRVNHAPRRQQRGQARRRQPGVAARRKGGPAAGTRLRRRRR